MPICECNNCGNPYQWNWEEAFDKFGFNDGDGQVETWQVEDVLCQAGYTVKVDQWGIHNVVIVSIKKGDQELIPFENPEYTFGYDDPRKFLPKEIVDLLDNEVA